MKKIQFAQVKPDIQGVYRTNITRPEQSLCVKYHPRSRFLLIEDGYAKFKFQDKVFETAPGSLVFIPAFSRYGTDFEMENHMVQICFDMLPARRDSRKDEGFHVLREETFFGDPSQEEILIEDAPIFNEPFLIESFPKLFEIAERFMREYTEKKYGYSLKLQAMLLDLLVSVHRYTAGQNTVRDTAMADAVLDYINQHCESKLLSNELSKEFHYSTGYLNKVVQGVSGMSLHQYILEAKVHRGEELLRNTDLPVATIAAQLSFYDSSHFSSVFQKAKGVSPNAYRRLWSE
jgi:AraC-like DNA-binding protein/mannose-6-phosphate isomerase-like protein (cupin superfamily)